MNLNKIPPAGFDLHEMMSPRLFGANMPKPTVTVLPILGDRIVMVSPLGVEGWWVPPQGSIRLGETAVQAAFRVLHTKLRMNHSELTQARIQPLCRFTNSIPEGRSDAGVEKEHYFVGVKLLRNAQIGVNKEMLSNLSFVATPQHLEALLHEVARARPVKHGGTMKAFGAAKARNMISWPVVTSPAPEMVH